MPDAITRLNAALQGRYTIEREIGEGGMATVYLAKDLRHNRNVALKVLKPELAAVVGAERFLAEIETTANLQHPHILPLYDSGEADSFLFYVMPFVEGETLRDRLDREKQFPVDEAVRIATAVANALHYAHQHGVVHRDIKPGNIMLQAGQPVVGDFGIALAVGSAGGARLTETGLSVGTPYYMSPEQATGDQLVGPSSDIYALGAVLYELLTGDPPYMGSTAQAVLGQIIAGDPVSATKKRRSIPANVDAAVRKSIEKLPADRFTSAHDFAVALADPAFRHGDAATRRAATGPGHWRTAAIAASILAVLFAGLNIQARNRPEPVRPVERFAVPFLEGQEPGSLNAFAFDLSPDGTMLVYRGQGRLNVRRWDELSATPVRETQGNGANNPAVSPDGLELAFERDNQIDVLALSGGPVRTLTTGTFPEWGPDGFVYASADSGAIRVPATGGAVEYLSRLEEGDNLHIVYDVLPGAEGALLMIVTQSGWEVRALDLGTGEMTFLAEGGGPRYLPSGHLVYGTQGGTIMAAAFDPRRMELLGTPIAVMDGVGSWTMSNDGKLFYAWGGAGGGEGPTLQLVWVTRSGQETPVDPNWIFQRGTDVNQGWTISPDGSRVALREYTDEGYDIWVKQLDTGPRSRLTFGEAEDRMPIWSVDGRDVYFLSNRGGNHDVWSKPADGTRDAELVVDLDADIATIDWSPDGELLLIRTSAGNQLESQRDILTYRPGVDGEATSLFAGAYREINPAISPDGRWIAYASDETGRYEVYVRPFPDVSAGRWQVSIDGGRGPQWAHTGREIFFQGEDQEMMVAAVGTNGGFSSEPPELLFEQGGGWLQGNITGTFYDVAPDDQRFLIATRQVTVPGTTDDTPAPPRVVLVNNFMEIVKAQVPRD